MSPDSGEKFLAPKRFRHVVVDVGIEPFEDVFFSPPRSQHHDGEVGPDGQFPTTDHPRESHPVQTRHHNVHHGDIRLVASVEDVSGCTPVFAHPHLVSSCSELVFHQLLKRFVVIDYEDIDRHSIRDESTRT